LRAALNDRYLAPNVDRIENTSYKITISNLDILELIHKGMFLNLKMDIPNCQLPSRVA